MADKSVRFNTSISTLINEKLNEHSEKTGLTKSAIVSQALVDYFLRYDLNVNGIEMVSRMIEENPHLFKEIMMRVNK